MSNYVQLGDVHTYYEEASAAAAERYRRNLWMSPWHENAAYLPS
jgi:hypothetical protein